MASVTAQSIMGFAIDDGTLKTLNESIPDLHIDQKPYCLEELMSEDSPQNPLLILCGPPPETISLIEIAQALRMQYQQALIFFVTQDRTGFDQKKLKKNGFSDAFLLPIDAKALTTSILDERAKKPGFEAKSFRTVNLVDLSADTVLDFDIYVHLRQNNKTIRFANQGEVFSSAQVSKLCTNSMQGVLIRRDQMPKFFQYTANQLAKNGEDAACSETEKREKTESLIRGLFSEIYNDSTDATYDQGKAFVSDCHQVVNAFLSKKQSDESWYERLVGSESLSSTPYSHASNTAAYAALFSIALAIGKPEDLAMAAVLHDIGLANVKQGEVESYEKHPFYSVEMIKSRKMVINENVMKIILQHHERFDGLGFPNKLVGSRIKLEAQLLAIADRMDELCSGTDGVPPVSPKHAFTRLHEENSLVKGQMPFNPELIEKLLSLFSPVQPLRS